jgi:hypothetical protein
MTSVTVRLSAACAMFLLWAELHTMGIVQETLSCPFTSLSSCGSTYRDIAKLWALITYCMNGHFHTCYGFTFYVIFVLDVKTEHVVEELYRLYIYRPFSETIKMILMTMVMDNKALSIMTV